MAKHDSEESRQLTLSLAEETVLNDLMDVAHRKLLLDLIDVATRYRMELEQMRGRIGTDRDDVDWRWVQDRG